MSRIGNNPITLPSGVDVSIDGPSVTVKGPKGTLERSLHGAITATLDDGVLTLTRVDDQRENRALHGLSRALLANMVEGVSDGFKKELQLVGVGYRAALKGKNIEVQVGFSHPVLVEALHGVGSKGRIMTPIGRAMVSDVQSHGPLVVIDGIAEDGQAYRMARHYTQVDVLIVLTDFEPGQGPEKTATPEAE